MNKRPPVKHAFSLTELGDQYIPFSVKEQQQQPNVKPMVGTQTGIPSWANGKQTVEQYDALVSSGHRRPSLDGKQSQYNPLQKCAIFWDFENCPPPSKMPGYVCVDQVRQAVHHFGQIMSFKAYLEINERSEQKHSKILRSELQSSGVSLTDVPHNGQKDAVDKMIMVDMLAFALDNPSPATVVLISGDKDFVYALSTLRNRRYTVVLIVPDRGAPIVLKSQAQAILDWKYDILNVDAWNVQSQEVVNNSRDNLVKKSTPEVSPTKKTAVVASRSSTPTKLNTQIKDVQYEGPIFSPVAPGFFDILIEVLEKLRLAGEPAPRRSKVGAELSKRNPLLYHRSGCDSFKAYVELALKENIVNIGGEKGNAWISLNDQHKDKLFAQ